MQSSAEKSARINAMAFRVFLSYSINPEEQVIVWRLQTLAAASGIYVYVPFRTQPPGGHAID